MLPSFFLVRVKREIRNLSVSFNKRRYRNCSRSIKKLNLFVVFFASVFNRGILARVSWTPEGEEMIRKCFLTLENWNFSAASHWLNIDDVCEKSKHLQAFKTNLAFKNEFYCFSLAFRGTFAGFRLNIRHGN